MAIPTRIFFVLICDLLISSWTETAEDRSNSSDIRQIDYYAEAPSMLGVIMTPVPLFTLKQYGLNAYQGVYIDSIISNTAADSMRLQPGDIILEMNSYPICSMSDERDFIYQSKIGDWVDVVFLRAGCLFTKSGQLKEWQADIVDDPLDEEEEIRYRNWESRQISR